MDVKRDHNQLAAGALVASIRARGGKTKRFRTAICLALTVILIASDKAFSEVTGSTDGLTGAQPAAQCSDLKDNDGDGLVDLADPDCSRPLDTSESGPSGSAHSGGNAGSTDKKSKGKKPGLFGKNKNGHGTKRTAKREKQRIRQPAAGNSTGSSTGTGQSLTTSQSGSLPAAVTNSAIDSFDIPTFLLPVYQSCGTEYGISWQVLAGINKVETDFGRNLNVSSAGAEGWMQFLPSTWKAYGVDANHDGKKDPYNPVDAICSSARYLKAAGGDQDIRQALLSYNHANWYVDEVLGYANTYAKLPDTLVSSLTGLTEGGRLPVAGKTHYADDNHRSINIYSSPNASVVAVNDGVIKKLGDNSKLGKYITLQDAYGNRYVYSHLGSIEKTHRVSDMAVKPLEVGSKVIGGTVLAHLGRTGSHAAHLKFAIRPAGRDARAIDPKSILQGWKLLENSAYYRTADQGSSAGNATVGQILLMSKAELEKRVLNDRALSIYGCGRNDIATHQIDRRVLAALEYLVAKGYRLSISSLKCGHSYRTSSGNVSAHSYGAAVDISSVNGISIAGHQGSGSITEAVIDDLLQLQGTMRPAQIISLMDLGGPSFSMSDHYDHIHVGYSFSTSDSSTTQGGGTLNAEQWQRLTQRLGEIRNPKVARKP